MPEPAAPKSEGLPAPVADALHDALSRASRLAESERAGLTQQVIREALAILDGAVA